MAHYYEPYPSIFLGGCIKQKLSTKPTVNPFYVVSFQHKNKGFNKQFAIKKYPSNEECVAACDQYRRQVSDQYGYTCIRPVLTESTKQYIAGFFDGDGCLELCKTKGEHVHFRVTIGQSQIEGIPDVLKFISECYRATYTFNDPMAEKAKRKDKHKVKRKPHHIIRIGGCYCVWFLLDVLVPYSILKSGQALCALRMMSIEHSERPKMFASFYCMKEMDFYQRIPIDSSDPRLTPAYITGMFDAEGTVASSRITSISIAQDSSPNLLRAILLKYGNPESTQNLTAEVNICGPYAEKLMRNMLRYSISKRSQIEAALQMRDYRKRKTLTEDLQQEFIRELKRAKKM
uniref:LAGLIDADG homing endonuclease n=1 Tax=Clandestinovirus TaxID=2831644 RepID=A0A8F8PK94_9VIRU|nr:LAGLIDADG homing endonuclease [Clandestinovirus]